VAAGLHRRGDGQLVPGPGHGARQRGGHRRGAQRRRQLPGVPATAAAVAAADHRVRRAAGRRPGPGSTGRSRSSCSSGTGSAPATAPSSRLTWRVTTACASRLHDPAGHPARGYLPGPGPRASARRRASSPTVAARHPRREIHGGPGRRRCGCDAAWSPLAAVRAYQRAPRMISDRQRVHHPRQDRGVHRRPTPSTRPRRADPGVPRGLRAGWATAPAPSWRFPRTTSVTWKFGPLVGLPVTEVPAE